jgi:hypothetical protein
LGGVGCGGVRWGGMKLIGQTRGCWKQMLDLGVLGSVVDHEKVRLPPPDIVARTPATPRSSCPLLPLQGWTLPNQRRNKHAKVAWVGGMGWGGIDWTAGIAHKRRKHECWKQRLGVGGLVRCRPREGTAALSRHSGQDANNAKVLLSPAAVAGMDIAKSTKEQTRGDGVQFQDGARWAQRPPTRPSDRRPSPKSRTPRNPRDPT